MKTIVMMLSLLLVSGSALAYQHSPPGQVDSGEGGKAGNNHAEAYQPGGGKSYRGLVEPSSKGPQGNTVNTKTQPGQSSKEGQGLPHNSKAGTGN